MHKVEIKIKPIDVNIQRRRNFTQRHSQTLSFKERDVPLFSVVEINSSGLCNRACVFCPRGNPGVFPNVNEFLSLSLFKKVVKELSSFHYDGLFLISAFSEPLLYKNLERMIEISKHYCPQSRMEIVTNGDLLTVKRLKSIMAAGLDTVLVSLYDGPEQIRSFEEIRADAGLKSDQMILRERYDFNTFNITNRGGIVSNLFEHENSNCPLKQQCFIPLYTVLMDYTGEVYICTHDWGRRLSFGNVKSKPLLEIWNCPEMNVCRGRLLKSDRRFKPCYNCNVNGTLVGESHKAIWKRYLSLE